MARKVNKATLDHIKEFEGLRLTAYPDPGSRDGTPYTIGYGSTKGVMKGMVITQQQADQRLVDDLTNAEKTVERLVNVPLNENQFGALVSFVFNIGGGAFEDSTLLRRLNAKDYISIPQQLKRWDKNDGKVMAGLTRRRASEAKLWETPVAANVNAPPQAPLEVKPVEVYTPEEEPIAKKPSWLVWLFSAIFAVAVVIFIAIQMGSGS